MLVRKGIPPTSYVALYGSQPVSQAKHPIKMIKKSIHSQRAGRSRFG
jgi:hypothetical protein